MKKKLLVIEDDPVVANLLEYGLKESFDVAVARDLFKAGELLNSGRYPVATLDLGLPPFPNDPAGGLKFLAEIRNSAPNTKIIVVTANTNQKHAIRSIELGAVDFCEKPVNMAIIKIILDRAFKIHQLETTIQNFEQNYQPDNILCGMLGVSSGMKTVFSRIAQAADTDYPVLICGESGTGKELAARAVHTLSLRSSGPLVIINCGAIPENLLESELFGHEKGAFSGAVEKKIGRLEMADKGTVFLDEIGDMPHALQVKMLRFLQEGTIERIGGTKTLRINVRVIAATHVDLEAAIEKGRFRKDLYYRLNVLPLDIPPLRERQEDILLLAKSFISEEVKQLKRKPVTLSADAAAALMAHSWPGNVRELQNTIRCVLAMSPQRIIKPDMLELTEEGVQSIPTLKEGRSATEVKLIKQAMNITENNVTKAAKLLGISRSGLQDLMKKHGIKRQT